MRINIVRSFRVTTIDTSKPFIVYEHSIGFGRTVVSASSGKFANFLIEVDSTDFRTKTEALKACSESTNAMHPGDW
jgi:hypothetical protein